MKHILFCLALALTSAAQAGLIIDTTSSDVTAYGFGISPPMLTLQAGGMEEGCVGPVGTAPSYTTTACGVTGIGLVGGPGKYASPTLADLGVTSWANLGILFNVNEENNVQEVTLQSLSLKLYDGTTLALLHSFNLLHPYDLTNITQGQGGAGFLITIEESQWGDLTFLSSYRLGLSARVGCETGPCDVAGQYGTGDGAESFTVASLAGEGPQEIPEPGTAALLGAGLIALAWTLRRRRAS